MSIYEILAMNYLKFDSYSSDGMSRAHYLAVLSFEALYNPHVQCSSVCQNTPIVTIKYVFLIVHSLLGGLAVVIAAWRC